MSTRCTSVSSPVGGVAELAPAALLRTDAAGRRPRPSPVGAGAAVVAERDEAPLDEQDPPVVERAAA